MKLDVNKLQQGGLFTVHQPLVFTPRTPAASAAGSSSKKTSSSESTPLLTKTVMNELIKNGLPNEVDEFLTQLHVMESSRLSSKTARAKTIALAKQANKIIHNKKQWDEAVTQAKNNEALSDYAVSDTGSLYVYDAKTQDITTVSLQTYAKSRENTDEYDENGELSQNRYIPLTVSQLAEYRAGLPQTAFTDNPISTIRQSVGISKISKSIWDIVKTLGDESSTQEDYATIAQMLDTNGMNFHTPSSEALHGLREIAALYQTEGQEAIFKLTTTQKGPRIEAAMKYIYSMLPQNAINQLQAKSIIEGREDTTPQNLIINALATGANTTNDFKVDIKEVNGSSSKTSKLGTMGMLTSGDLGTTTLSLVTNDRPNHSINFPATAIGQLAHVRTNETVSPGIMYNCLQGAEMNQLIDNTQIYAGTQRITPIHLQQFIYEGGELMRSDVPVGPSGEPDFTTAQRVSDLMERFKADPSKYSTDEAKTQALLDMGIQGSFEEGVFKGAGRTEPFYVVTGLTTDSVIQPSGNIFAQEVPESEEDIVETFMDQTYALYNKGKKGDAQIDNPNKWLSDFVRVPIFLKIHPNAGNTILTASGIGLAVSVPSYQESMAREQYQQTQAQYQQLRSGASSALLYPKQ